MQHADLALVLTESHDPLVRELGASLVVPTAERKRGASPGTVGLRFREQLRSLVAGLDTTQLHFVRCVKPNGKQRPGDFDRGAVLRQLRCCGVLETVRLARAGFPVRHPYAEFFELYAPLASLLKGRAGEADAEAHAHADADASEDLRTACVAILRAYDVPPADYRLGQTRLFCRAGVLSRLEDQAARVRRAALVIQRQYRMSRQRRRYLRLRAAAVLFQAFWRGVLARRRVAELLREREAAAACIQQAWRVSVARALLKKRALEEEKEIAARRLLEEEEEQKQAARQEAHNTNAQTAPGYECIRDSAGCLSTGGSVSATEAASHLIVDGGDVAVSRTVSRDVAGQGRLLEEALTARHEAESEVALLRSELAALRRQLARVESADVGTASGSVGPAWTPHSSRYSGPGVGRTPEIQTPDDISYRSASTEEGGSPFSAARSPSHAFQGGATAGAVAALAGEFGRKTALLDDDASFIGEVHAGVSDAPGMDAEAELAALHRRFSKWKASYKQRLVALDKAFKSSKKAGRKTFLGFGGAGAART